MRRTLAVGTALLAAALLLTSCINGWWSDDPAASRPKTEIVLPTDLEAWDATSSYPPSTVSLAVGQRLGVQTTEGARPRYWYLTSAGDGTVLRRGPDVDINPCPKDPPVPGCSSGVDQTFTALAPGTTTLTWVFGSGEGCGAGAPGTVEEECRISKSIQVTVH
jgi:hypothetical protein